MKTQSNKDYMLRLTSLAVLALSLFAGPFALARVELENTIQKVETFINADGEVQRRLVDVESVVPGDEIRYTIHFANTGEQAVDAGSIVITDHIPDHTEYLEGTAFGSGTDIIFSTDGEQYGTPADLTIARDGEVLPAGAADYRSIRWVFAPALAPA